jgi:hypothetical protein
MLLHADGLYAVFPRECDALQAVAAAEVRDALVPDESCEIRVFALEHNQCRLEHRGGLPAW